MSSECFQLFDEQRKALEIINQEKLYTLLVGGARSGKTFIYLYYILMFCLKYANARWLICRKHLSDIKGSIINDSLFPLIRLLSPDGSLYQYIQKNFNRVDWVITFPNMSQIWFVGLGNQHQSEKVLGRGFTGIFVNEAPEILYEVIQKLMTRLSHSVSNKKCRLLLDCNPTNTLCYLYQLFVEKKYPNTDDPIDTSQYVYYEMQPDNNPHLPERYVEDILGSLSEQMQLRFRYGQWLTEVSGALWRLETIEKNRQIQTFNASKYNMIAMGVDPAGGSEKISSEVLNEWGIIIAGTYFIDGVRHADIIEDYSGKYNVEEAGKAIVFACKKYQVKKIIIEVNQGCDMCRLVVKHVCPITARMVVPVRATIKKEMRADPVVSLDEHGLIHHIKKFKKLEAQMVSWLPTDNSSPDRIDARVWVIYALMLKINTLYQVTEKGVETL